MRILVTGGAGFIGSAFVRKAIALGHQVFNIDKLTYAASLKNVESVADNKNYRFAQIDICDAPSVQNTFFEFDPDAVVHFAAESHVDRSIDGAEIFLQTNILGTYQLLNAACLNWKRSGEMQKRRFIHVSTDEVFGSLGEVGYFEESSSYAPNSPYAASKASADHLVRAWGKTFDLPVIITNCSNNYGPYQFPEKLIPVTILNALSGHKIPLYGDGKQVRDWLHVDDHIDALLRVLADGAVGETYAIGGQNESTNYELVRKICASLDRLKSKQGSYFDLVEFVTDRPGHDRRYAINSEKLQTQLDWNAKYNLDAGIDQTVQWYLANSEWVSHLLSRDGVGSRLGLLQDNQADAA